MSDHVARPVRASSSARVAELHQLCDADYAKGEAERATAHATAFCTPFATADAVPSAPEPTDLDVAIRVAQELVDSDQLVSVREALRILLRALGAEPVTATAPQPPAVRCPAAHPEDPTPCQGPTVVTILDRDNAGADGCEHHAARLLASLDGSYPIAMFDAPAGTASRVFKAADGMRPFPWLTDAPRTRDDQLSRAEVRERGDGQ